MIAADKSLVKVLYKDSTVKTAAGCLIEYNMNTLLDNILVKADLPLEQSYLKTEDGKINMFKQLFPIDSIVKPFRPEKSGIKYFILLNGDLQAVENRTREYDEKAYPVDNTPRLYYPAVTNSYKYWVTPENSTFDITVNYVISSATIESAYSTGPEISGVNQPYPERVVYTTTSPHGFAEGQVVSISGGTALNLSNQTISSILSPTQFLIQNNVAATTSTGGTATLSAPTKPALSNKVVVRFEKYHLLPSSCKVLVTYSDNTNSGELTFASTSYSDGSLILYWNGTTWIAKSNSYVDGPYTTTQPVSWPAPKEVKSIRVWTTVSSGSERIYGITEVSARWVKDITNDLVSFSIKKESSETDDSILPVGTITANSLQASLVKYDQDKLKIISYNRSDSWKTNPKPEDSVYLYKNVMLTPYFIVHHINGKISDGSSKYDRIKQGTFYIAEYDVSTYGDTEITALDGSKYLMETLPIDLYLENVPITSVIMAILDTIGFSNYKFNSQADDASIPVVKKWWTDNEKTAWEHIQELCRDIQMNAFFDENNMLQFYSRDYIYNQSNISWKFFEKPGNVTVGSGGDVETITALANMATFSNKEIASANQVKIIWRVPMSSLYEGNAEPLWNSSPSFLIAAPILEEISASTPSELVNMCLNFEDQEIKSTFNFNGYLLLNSEIFEYDALEFKFQKVNSNTWEYAWIDSQSTWASVRSQTKIDPVYFKSTGKVRIKKRAALGTVAANHKSTAQTKNTEWELVETARWDA